MTTAYTSLLGLALPVTGELSGTWGDTVNTAITSLLDTAVAGTTSITVDADITLSTTTGASNEARQAIILWNPASGTTTRNITAPAQSKIYTVINASGGTQSIVIRGAGPTTGVTIAKGEAATVAWNGSDFVKVSSSGGAITFTDLTVTGNTILGDAAADTLTVNATSTFASPVNFQGLVKLPSTGRSAAAALTTTAPAFLYGVASTYTDTTSSGTIAAVAPFYSIAQPTLSTSNVTTYTNAATLYIANAPAAGGSATITNPFAVYVAAGASYFGGAVTLNAGTANGVAYLNGSKALTTGTAITYDGTTFAAPFTSLSANGVVLTVDRTGTGGNDRINAQFSNSGTVRGGIGTVGAADGIYFTQGTTEGMRLTSDGLGVVKNVFVGSGATSASYTRFWNASGYSFVGVEGNTGGTIATGTTAYAAVLASSGTNLLQFAPSGTVAGTFIANGNFGLGTNNPAYNLQVAGADAQVAEFTSSATATAVRINNTNAAGWGGNLAFYSNGTGAGFVGTVGSLFGNTTQDIAMYATAGNGLRFYTNGSNERGRFDSSGNFMVGTTTATGKVSVAGAIAATANSLIVNPSVAVFGLYTSGAIPNTYVQMPVGGSIDFWKPDTSNAGRIDSSGNFLINTTTSSSKLTLNGTQTYIEGADTRVGTIKFSSGGFNITSVETELNLLTPYSSVVFYTGTAGTAAERARITAGGQLLVGTTTTSGGEIARFQTASGATSLGLIASTSGSCFLNFGDTSDANVGFIGYDHTNNYMNFRTNGAEAMRINSSQALIVGGTSATNSAVITATKGSGSMGMSAYAGANNNTINTIASGAGSGGGMIIVSGVSFGSGQSFSRLYLAGVKVPGGAASVFTTAISAVGEAGVSFTFADSGGYVTATASGLPNGSWTVMWINN